MKVGDEIRIREGEEYRDYAGRYCGTIGTVLEISCHDLYKIALYDGKLADFPRSYLKPIVPRIRPKKCSCGAKHTSFPNHHEHWCDIHMTIKMEEAFEDFFNFDDIDLDGLI